MIFNETNPPRVFKVGNRTTFDMKDCGSIRLDADEQITLLTANGAEFDVARKEWGFYATPSLNGRLQQFGLRAVIIRNMATNRYFVLLVEVGKEALFDRYCYQENLGVIAWLDSTDACDAFRQKLSAT
jgi:hypothetical protein